MSQRNARFEIGTLKYVVFSRHPLDYSALIRARDMMRDLNSMPLNRLLRSTRLIPHTFTDSCARKMPYRDARFELGALNY